MDKQTLELQAHMWCISALSKARAGEVDLTGLLTDLQSFLESAYTLGVEEAVTRLDEALTDAGVHIPLPPPPAEVVLV